MKERTSRGRYGSLLEKAKVYKEVYDMFHVSKMFQKEITEKNCFLSCTSL